MTGTTLRARWDAHYARAMEGNPLAGVHGLLAYNSVVDNVRVLDAAFLGRLDPPPEVPPLFAKPAEDLRDLAEGLCYSISRGVALEVICGPRVIRFLEEAGGYEPRPGGQVLTVARLLSDFGAETVLVHPDRFNWEVASLYQGSRAQVPLMIRGRTERVPAQQFFWECEPEVHYMLEYPAGLAFGGPPSPRANRFIAAPTTRILFHREWERALPEAARACEVLFLAGLNHMGDAYQEAYRRVREHIRTAKGANPSLVVHLEITSMPDLRKREAVVEEIVPLVDSIGVNEAELADLAFTLGLPRWEAVREDPAQQVRALELLRALGVDRAHMHTLGHYLALSPNPSRRVRRSLLFAALVGAARARSGESPRPENLAAAADVPLAKSGLKALDAVAKALGLQGENRRTLREEGWAEEELVVVPARLVSRPVYTVGLGDVISGAAVFGEVGGGDPQG